MTDESKCFLLSDTMDDMLGRLSRLPAAEKTEHAAKVGKLVDVLLHDVMPRAVAQPNISFSLFRKLKQLEQSRPISGSAALSASWGYESYETYHEQHLVVDLKAGVLGNGPTGDIIVKHIECCAADGDCPLSVAEQDLLACYLFLQHLFGPEPDLLTINLTAAYPTSCSLSQYSWINATTV